MKPALLIIDIQNQFFNDSETIQSLNEAIRYINAAIEIFRENNLPIVVIQHINEKSGLIPGSSGFDVPTSIKLLNSDIRIHKTYRNSFNKTKLADELRELGVDTIILAGFCAERCVLHTYCGARDHDIAPIMLKGGLAGDIAKHVRYVEEITDIITLGALRAMLSKANK
jgi:nicotinamidase-related amidase